MAKNKFLHEEVYRGKKILDKIKNFRIVICGSGAIGSNLIDNLSRQGFSNILIIDKDRIEPHNINTQVWSDRDIGALKSDEMKNKVFRNTGFEVESFNKELTNANASKHFKKADLVVDAFDNNASRKIVQDNVRSMKINCIHAGLFEDYGEVIWDEQYKVPVDVTGVDVCDYPLARNIIMLTVSALSEEILSFVTSNNKRNFSITLKDLKITKI